MSYVLVTLFLKLEYTKGGSLKDRLQRIDWISNFLFAISITLVLVAIPRVSITRR